MLVTSKPYVTVSPAVSPDAIPVFARLIDGCATGTVTEDDVEVTGFSPAGGVPVAVAVLVKLPAVRSAWVTVWVPVQVSVAPAASEAGQVAAESRLASLTVTGERGTLPVLVTLNV